MQAIVMAKCLHFMSEEGSLDLSKKHILELGCGMGLLGIYLACIGGTVMLTDLPVVKDMVERNINLNKKLLKGSA